MPPLICQAPKEDSTNAIVSNTAGTLRGSDPEYVAYRSTIFERYGFLVYRLVNFRSDNNGAITRRSDKKPFLAIKLLIDFSSDSTNGVLDASHICSARCIKLCHSSPAAFPKTDSIESQIPLSERFGKVNFVLSAKLYSNAGSTGSISRMCSIRFPVFKKRSRYTAGRVRREGPVSNA